MHPFSFVCIYSLTQFSKKLGLKSSIFSKGVVQNKNKKEQSKRLTPYIFIKMIISVYLLQKNSYLTCFHWSKQNSYLDHLTLVSHWLVVIFKPYHSPVIALEKWQSAICLEPVQSMWWRSCYIFVVLRAHCCAEIMRTRTNNSMHRLLKLDLLFCDIERWLKWCSSLQEWVSSIITQLK